MKNLTFVQTTWRNLWNRTRFFYSQLIKSDPQGTTEATTHNAHINRLLDGLAAEKQLALNYLMTTWEDYSKTSAKDVFKVRLKLIKKLGTGDSILAAGGTIDQKQGLNKEGDKKCTKHPHLYCKCTCNQFVP